MLSPEELLTYRIVKSQSRALPSLVPKIFKPSGSEEEQSCIQQMLRERFELLREERVERRDLLAVAEWDHDVKLACVTRKVGNFWDSFGFEKNGSLYLQPEEALFLVEIVKLEMSYNGVPMSVQQCYQIVLRSPCCSAEQYHVFSHLSRHGFHLKRTKIRKRKITGEELENGLAKKLKLETSTYSWARKLTIKESEERMCLLDRIPDCSRGQLNLSFIDQTLLPETCQPSRKSYQYSWRKAEDDQPTTSADEGRTSWSSITPLVSHSLSKEVLMAKLRMFKTLGPPAEGEVLPLVYDVFSPSKHFRKSSPGVPCYQVAIAKGSSPFPDGRTLRKTLDLCHTGVTLIIAVVQQNYSVSFYEVSNQTLNPAE